MIERLKKSRAAAGDGGFTLIELLVVIIILGILAAVVVFAVGGVGDKGQSAACKIDTRTLRTAEEAYWASPGGGQYASELTLQTGGFLSEQSSYHDVALAAGNASFTIQAVAANCGGPGTVNAASGIY